MAQYEIGQSPSKPEICHKFSKKKVKKIALDLQIVKVYIQAAKLREFALINYHVKIFSKVLSFYETLYKN